MGKTFYQELNKSIKDVNNQAYIEKTKKIMTQYLQETKPLDKILVIGAGNLNDFSLPFFQKWFKTIYLSDIDTQSIYNNLKVKEKNKIQVKEIDYLGLEETAFFSDYQHLLTLNSLSEIEDFIADKLASLNNKHFSLSFETKFDCIYLCPIYTQLLYREAEVKLTKLEKLGLKKTFSNYAKSLILQGMIRIIDNFNQEIIALLKENGIVFLSTDILELTDNYLSELIVKRLNANQSIEDLYLDYLNAYGYGFGDYGLLSISKILKTKNEEWLLWQMDKDKSYAVKFAVLIK